MEISVPIVIACRDEVPVAGLLDSLVDPVEAVEHRGSVITTRIGLYNRMCIVFIVNNSLIAEPVGNRCDEAPLGPVEEIVFNIRSETPGQIVL